MHYVKLKGTRTAIEKEFVKTGNVAPDFTLTDQNLKECKLQDFGNKKKLLSIVPSLDTEVCLISTKILNQAAKENKNLMILIISADLPFAQKRICGLEKLENIKTLSMMKNKNFGKDYGVLIAEGPLEGLCSRAIVVLDENNKIIYTELVEEISTEPNYEKALKALRS